MRLFAATLSVRKSRRQPKPNVAALTVLEKTAVIALLFTAASTKIASIATFAPIASVNVTTLSSEAWFDLTVKLTVSVASAASIVAARVILSSASVSTIIAIVGLIVASAL